MSEVKESTTITNEVKGSTTIWNSNFQLTGTVDTTDCSYARGENAKTYTALTGDTRYYHTS